MSLLRILAMKTVKFGNLEIGEIHRIVGTVHMKTELSQLPKLVKENAVDILELRADQLYEEGRELVKNSLKQIKQFHLPVIATVREGEGYNFADAERLKLFGELIPEVDVVDIELRAEIRDDVLKIARERKKSVIVSEHNLAQTPPDSELENILSESRSCGADVTKIAVYANSGSDVSRLMRFTLKQSVECTMVCISLGDIGAISRTVAPILGSALSYGYIDNPVAPGQSSLVSLNTELKKYFKNLHKR